MKRLMPLLALACTTKTTPVGPVVISELMYHPVQDDGPSEDHEFVEIANRTDAPVAIGGWRLAGGASFMFPAGTTLAPSTFLVIAKNRQKLLSDVPAYRLDPTAVLGDYAGDLDNDGDRIALLDGAGKLVDEALYGDGFPYPIGADGLGASDDWLPPDQLPIEKHRFMGRSLERINLGRSGLDIPNWAASGLDGATPGRPNGAAGEPPAIAERLTVAREGGGQGPIRAADVTLVRVWFSARIAGPVIEWYVEDLQRDDEPHSLLPLSQGPDGYQARLPPQPAGAIVRYRVLADRGRGEEVIAPRDSDPLTFFAYPVAADITGATPAYQLFIKPADWTSLWDNTAAGRTPGNGAGTNPLACSVNELWNVRVPALLVANNDVYDVRVRYEGSFQGRLGGNTIDPKKWPETAPRPERPSPLRALSWSIKFPRYHRLDGKRSFNLNKLTQSCHGFNTQVGDALFERAGIPAAHSSHVRLYINGAYYHYMLRMEHLDEDFVKRAFGKGPQGDLFKSVGGRWDEGPFGYSDERPLAEYCGYTVDQRYDWSYDRSNDTGRTGSAEVRKLVEELTAARAAGLPAIRKFFEDNFDMAALTTYIAVINWMVAWDDQYHNHYLYKRPDGRWMMLPTDMDNMMGGAAPSTADASFFAGQWNVRSNRNDYWNQLKDAFLRAYRAEFIARVKELDRTVLAPDAVAALAEQLTASFQLEEAMASPAGMSCGLPAPDLKRLVDFAYDRSARIAAGLFD
jgi:hypothetical protein